MMSFLLVISRSGFCHFCEARHPSRPTAFPFMGVHTMFPINTTASEVLLPNNHYSFYSLGAPKFAPDHLETPGEYKLNQNPPPRCSLFLFFSALSLPSSSLVVRLAFLVVLLFIRWTHHRAGRTTCKHQPCPLRNRPSPWAHVFLFVFFIFFVHFLLFRLFSFLIPGTWYSLVVARYLFCIVDNVVGHFRLILCCR